MGLGRIEGEANWTVSKSRLKGKESPACWGSRVALSRPKHLLILYSFHWLFSIGPVLAGLAGVGRAKIGPYGLL